MDYHQEGDCIECTKAEIFAKKFVKGPPQRHHSLGLTIKLTCSRDGSAEIKEELVPKEHKFKKASILDAGSCLRAERFYAILQAKTVPSEEVVGGHTGTHKSRKIVSKCFTFAEISVPFSHIINAIENRRRLEQS